MWRCYLVVALSVGNSNPVPKALLNLMQEDPAVKKYIEEIKPKKYGLVWETNIDETKEKIDHSILPTLEYDKSKSITKLDGSDNILIEGDNLYALQILNYTHKEKIDVIYIDPPYNTGNNTWKYNNKFVNKSDAYRHSKWLSFMYERLKLAKKLLSKSGIIVVAIDDYEVHTLRLLMDEIFKEENRLATIIVESNPSGRTSDKFFATSHEYFFVYTKDPNNANIGFFDLTDEQKKKYSFNDSISHYKWRDFLRTGGYSTPKERPNSYYPIYYDPATQKIDIEYFKRSIKIFPIDTKGQKRVWRQTKPSLLKLLKNKEIKIDKRQTSGEFRVLIKDRIKLGMMAKTIWTDSKYGASTHGTKLLENILGKARMFEFPKSVYTMFDIFYILTKSNPNAVILDFFAGSGTTGHAVLELNKHDDGNRKFILCTNNENNICVDVCQPRLSKVIHGYMNNSGKHIEGYSSKLHYFRINDEVKPNRMDKRRIMRLISHILCVKESCFILSKTSDRKYRIYENKQRRYFGVIYTSDAVEDYLKTAERLICKKIPTYVFSYSDTISNRLKNNSKVIAIPVPDPLLRLWNRGFRQ